MNLRTMLVLIASAAAPAAAQPADDSAYAAVVERTVADYILPAHRHLAEAAAALAAAAESYCDAPSVGGAARLETAFADVVAAWAGVDFLRFGPMARDGRHERFAYWPDVHGTGARQLRLLLANEDPAVLEPGALAEQSAAVQGLPALETLLHSGEKALLRTSEPDPFRCGLAAAIGGNLRDIATAALDGWTGEENWAALLTQPAASNPVYRSHSESMTELLKGTLTALEQVRNQRLLPALGASADTAMPGRAPYVASGQTLDYIAAGIRAVQRYVETSGLLALAPEPEARALSNSIAFEFANLLQALEIADADFEAAITAPASREKLLYAALVMQSLRDTFQNRVAPAAGLTAGFNALDGD